MHYIGTLETLEIPNKRCKYTYFNGTNKKPIVFGHLGLYIARTHTQNTLHTVMMTYDTEVETVIVWPSRARIMSKKGPKTWFKNVTLKRVERRKNSLKNECITHKVRVHI